MTGGGRRVPVTEEALFKKLLTAVVAVGAVALYAPVASASHATVNCRFNAVSQATATGQDTWEGHAQGYIVGNTGEPVSIRCVVKVNGTVRAATAWGSGNTVATTQDRVTYVRTLTQVTQLCAQYTTSHGAGETCFATTTTQVPPQEVYDALDAVITEIDNALGQLDPVFDIIHDIEVTYVDPVACPALAARAGTYGGPPPLPVITITANGDILVDGELWWDCPGYEPVPA